MAVDLLVKAEDNVNPLVNQGALWKRGDIVQVRQVPHQGWGALERFPFFWIITIESINLDDPAIPSWIAEDVVEDANGNPVSWTNRRKLYLNVDALPPPVRNDILGDGLASIAPNRLQGFRDAIQAR